MAHACTTVSIKGGRGRAGRGGRRGGFASIMSDAFFLSPRVGFLTSCPAVRVLARSILCRRVRRGPFFGAARPKTTPEVSTNGNSAGRLSEPGIPGIGRKLDLPIHVAPWERVDELRRWRDRYHKYLINRCERLSYWEYSILELALRESSPYWSSKKLRLRQYIKFYLAFYRQ